MDISQVSMPNYLAGKLWLETAERRSVVDGLSGELGRLRRGRGIMASDVRERAGPVLRSLAGIDDACTEAEARSRLIRCLDELAACLPDDLRIALRASLALDEEVQHRFLEERMNWLAGQLHRDIRTARRRAAQAIAVAGQLSGSVLDSGSDYVTEGWYLARFRTFLRLDGRGPIAIEERTITATKDQLSEILVSASIPSCQPGAAAEHTAEFSVLYGGKLARQERPSATYFRHFIELPHPLRRGESHEFGVAVSIPPKQSLNPRYAFKPVRRCDEFDLRIRFAPAALPREAWNLAGLPQGLIEDYAADEALLYPDDAGEIHITYQCPRIGLVYGIRWEA